MKKIHKILLFVVLILLALDLITPLVPERYQAVRELGLLNWTFGIIINIEDLLSDRAPSSDAKDLAMSTLEPTSTPRPTSTSRPTPIPRPTRTPKPTSTPIVWTAVTSDEILTAYRANEIAADYKYANRPLEVTGRISSPGFEKFSDKTRYEVILIDDTRIISDRLRCRLRATSSNTNWVAELIAGDTVTVRGYIRGEWFVNVIDLEDCLPIAP